MTATPSSSIAKPPIRPPMPRPTPKYAAPKMHSTVAAVDIGDVFLMKEKTAMRRKVVQNGFSASSRRNHSKR